MLTTLGGSTRQNSFAVARHNITGKLNSVDEHVQTGVNGDKRSKRLDLMASGLGGTHVTAASTNPVLEYETPFYSKGQRFVPARKINLYDTVDRAHELSCDVPGSTPSNAYRIDRYVSIAEDFQLGMYVGAPIVYYYGDPDAVS